MAREDPDDLYELLERHWGYRAFRPAQEEIVRSLMAGRDVVAVLPTGGGKSLCYQLPAMALGKVCVVVSPLISLMQDQAGHMKEAQIPAGSLNSHQDWARNRAVTAAAEQGKLRLLYVSPERLLREDTIAWLNRVPLGLIAIDEAHCISEWGHEFRPEYRQLSVLREAFPETPIAAFTASATRRVRHDIVAQLRLRNPAKFVRSFHRPNLQIVVKEMKDDALRERHLKAALAAHTEGRVIVYAPTVKEVESMAALLSAHGCAAVPYHGQMDAGTRKQNQAAWMRGEPRILVGTVAFGLGINQPDVRAVIHLSLPKSLEQYYQEAGRAGRDGNPAECILLWRKKDIGLAAYFLEQLTDSRERNQGWERLKVMRGFAEAKTCRHRLICEYFGETPVWQECGVCDVCGHAPEWLETLTVRKKRAKPKVVVEVESAALERLKAWRAEKARELKWSAYMVFHNATLQAIAEADPADLAELGQVKGVGQAKVAKWGKEILALLR
jgi:ATP-dependent DNA helicase RecQ